MAKDTKQNTPVASEQSQAQGGWLSLHSRLAEMEKVFERFFGRNWPVFANRTETSLFGDMDLRIPNVS